MALSATPIPPAAPVEWHMSTGRVAYPAALAEMEGRAAAIRQGTSGERVWLLEHPSLYTAGTSADMADLKTDRLPVHVTGRGGQLTYHGPGQRVVYLMLDLKRRRPDLRRFVATLEDWVIAALDRFVIRGERREGRVGIWVDLAAHGRPGHEAKIAAIGIRVKRWVSFHGLAINVDPDLSHFDGIVPCGIAEHGVTSLVDLGLPVTLGDLDAALMATWPRFFEGEGPMAPTD